MGLLCDVLIGLGTGLISGGASGYLVYRMTKWREKKYETYYFCRNYLFGALRHCEIDIPVEQIEELFSIDGKDGTWGKAIYEIMDATRLFDAEDRELSEREKVIADNVEIALEELEKWKKKNRLH